MLRAEWPSLIAELHGNNHIDDEQLEAYRYLNIVGLVGSIEWVGRRAMTQPLTRFPATTCP